MEQIESVPVGMCRDVIGNASPRIACSKYSITRAAGCINGRQSAGSIPCNNTFGAVMTRARS